MNNHDDNQTVVLDDQSEGPVELIGVPSVSRLHPEAEKLLNASLEARIQFVLSIPPIRYPAFEAIKAQAEWMIFEPVPTRARGLVVSAERGNGKTTLADAIHAHYKDASTLERPRIVKISMSGARDARTVYGRILEELGSPARISHRLSDREMLVRRLLQSMGCRMLVLDEVQDILLGNEREQQRALEGIKFMMNEIKVHVLAFGTDKAFQGFSSDPHLEARFTESRLPAWKAGPTLANFVATYERFLPFKRPSILASPENLKMLAKAGGGSLGKIVERLQNAALAAMCADEAFVSPQRIETSMTRPAQCALKVERTAR